VVSDHRPRFSMTRHDAGTADDDRSFVGVKRRVSRRSPSRRAARAIASRILGEKKKTRAS